MTTGETTPEPQLRLPLPVVGVVAALLVLGLTLSVAAGGDWWQVLVLGVVQGLTEFLPISSTGHLLIVSRLLGFQNSIGGTFEIFIQLGTVFSVLAFYGADLLRQVRAVAGQGNADEMRAARRLWLALLVAFVPAALVGAAFRTQIKAVLFESPATIAYALIVGGVALLLIELLPRRRAQTTALSDVSLAQALGVGLAQVLALVPGVSRSGSSIVGGLVGGLDRRTATAFSFYLAIPTLGAATLVDMLGAVRDGQIGAGDVGRLLLGAVVAMIVGWLSIGWLLRYVSRNSYVLFGVYRIVAGALILALVAAGRL
ncbi:MAG: undecaprenyl-diphosphate phosphatase [Chloroflexales bacterium]|nr:undecaprenyl-diphosphate phosphatase [Chloroflexales bacterium]